MRIEQHPILNFNRGEKANFFFNGKEIEGYTNETIVSALHASGIKELAKSPNLHRPRGLFCAIGNCSSCLMVVDGKPNIRACVVKVRPGMKVETQQGKGDLL
ncbi:MAG: (2Fe-2S)-binding protein [Treponema sp.]|nr:(2Fe-2S)-binding protein [Treponema sp.]